MSDPTDEERKRALEARKRLKRRTRAVAFEAYEDAELRREEEIHKLSAPPRSHPRPEGKGFFRGVSSRKAKPSQRGR
ncbi:MAG: hypothetical protein NW223_11980 [Hyphomicrobiaceae bacterium]|nr:hypothetical protein [Hyphomicrobiaceae bacterium]